MRLSKNDVLAAFDHPNEIVRHLALNYFTCAFSDDPRVMPAFIRAVEKFGVEHHDAQLRATTNLIQTEATVRWLLDQFTASADDEARQDDLACILAHAAGGVLRKFEAEIAASPTLPEDLKAAISDSIALVDLPPEELWQRFEAMCGEVADEDADGFDPDMADRLAAALGGYPDFVTERVRGVLAGTPITWRYPEYAARIARHARLDQAVPELVEAMTSDSTYLAEEAQDALAAIGSDITVDLLRSRWAGSQIDFHLTAVCILEATHLDHSVECALALAESADDDFTKDSLLGVALRNFDTRAVEVVRRHLNSPNRAEELRTLQATLLAVCEMMNITLE